VARNDKLIVQYLPLVQRIAWRMAEQLCADRDDFVSSGMVGLVEAARRFDRTKGKSFVAYATLRIRGEIMDDFRRLDTLPRSERARRKKDPHRAETGKGSQFHSWREFHPNALARAVDPRDKPLRVRRDAAMTVTRLLQKIPPRLREVLILYWLEDKTDPEIGEMLGVTGSRVCQLRKKAQGLLRKAADQLGVTIDDI